MNVEADSARAELVVSIDIDALLDAMDGWVYLVDTQGTVVAVGSPAWDAFAGENAGEEIIGEVVGRDLFEQIAGRDVQATYRRMHEALVSGRRREITFDYRCDAPDTERHMRMSLSAVRDGDVTVAILYQSQLNWQASRPPIGLFESAGRPAPRLDLPADRILAMCSFCHAVAWPLGAADSDREWIEPGEYDRRGGASDVAVSHGMCPPCNAQFLARI